MHLPEATSKNSGISLLLVGIVLIAALLMAYLNAYSVNDSILRSARDRASTIANSLGTEDLKGLTGNPDDKQNPAWLKLKTRLRTIRESNDDVRRVYLVGIRQGELFEYVDSELTQSKFYHEPGSRVYADSQRLFVDKTPSVEGPLSDHTGGWLMGIAPIVDLESGRVVAAAAIDVDDAVYRETIFTAALVPLLVGAIVLILITFFEWSRRRMQRELRLRSELVSIASHELRTPITGIRWVTERLLKQTEKTPHHDQIKAVHTSVLHLQASIEDILELTRMAKQAHRIHLTEVNMSQLVGEICSTQALAAQQKNVTLTLQPSWQPDVIIRCDADKIKRAMHNLVSNAIKYTAEGTEITIGYESQPKAHTITIADHGIGIPEAEKTKVFGGFYRASNAKAKGIEGTGLGLYLTRTIITQHGGTISFTSEENKGTTFRITLPG